MLRRTPALATWTGVLLAAARLSLGQQVLYGGNEWLQFPSVNTGWLVRVDPGTGATTLVGKPDGIERISGLAFDDAGTLWAISLTGTPSGTVRTGTLHKLDPATGALLETIGPVRDGPGGAPISIESLTIQPGTGVFYGSRGISDLAGHGGDVYRIDPFTGVATLFADNNNGYQLATVAFSPSGTLYQSSATYPTNPGGNPRLQVLDPATGAVLTSVPTARFYKALAIRADGAMFGAASVDNMASEVDDFFAVDPATGTATFLGQTGDNPVGCLAFGPAGASCDSNNSCSAPRGPVLAQGTDRPDARVVVRPER